MLSTRSVATPTGREKTLKVPSPGTTLYTRQAKRSNATHFIKGTTNPEYDSFWWLTPTVHHHWSSPGSSASLHDRATRIRVESLQYPLPIAQWPFSRLCGLGHVF